MNVPSAIQLDQTRAVFDSNWGGVDDVLYDLCRRFPDHSSRRGVMAKVVLIARAYATGLERCVTPPKGEQAIVVVGAYMHKWGGEVDRIVAAVRQAAEPLDAAAMSLVVQQHGRLTALLKQMPECRVAPRSLASEDQPERRVVPRSFASKYLHFHHPAVPIYDSYAAGSLARLVPWSTAAVPFDRTPEGDAEYSNYCARLFCLYSACRRSDVETTIKTLDAYLSQVPT